MANQRKKILYLVTQSDNGGAQQYVYQLATAAAAAYDTVVASGEQPDGGTLGPRLQAAGVRHAYLSHLKRAVHPWHDLAALRQLITLIRTERPDIIHLNSTKISVLGTVAARLAGTSARVAYTVHGWVFDEQLTWRDADYYLHLKPLAAFIERAFARGKDALIILSDKDYQTALRYRIAPKEKLHVIYNGREPLSFLDRTAAREKLNLADNSLVIGTISNLYPAKGLTYLLEAGAQLVKQSSDAHPAMRFVIIGEGPERARLQQQATALGMAGHIHFAGSIPDAATLLKAFDLYVLPSTKEGLPFALIEAMQAGLPIVATEVGAVAEVITTDVNGVLVPPGDAPALARALQGVIDDPAFARRLAMAAQAAAAGRFTAAAMATATMAVYDALLPR